MKKRYSTLQIKTEVKEKLDVFCNANGYKLSGFVEKLIESTIGWTPSVCRDNVIYYIDSGSCLSRYSQSYCSSKHD